MLFATRSPVFLVEIPTSTESHSKRPFSRSGEYVRRDYGDVISIRVVLKPTEELGNAVDLIVMTAVWKRQQLGEEFGKPSCALGQMNVTRFDLRRLSRHSVDLAPLRLDADRTCHA